MQRIGLVGCGRWGRHILRDLRSLGCEVVVVARSEASRQRAAEGGAAAIVSHVDDLPEDLDGYVVAVTTVAHGQVIEALLPRQRPIFVEKPLTPDLATSRQLVAMAGERLFVMDKWRYHPGIERLRELVRTEALGPVSLVRSVRLGWGNPHADVDPVWILAPHDLAIALEILGHLPPPEAAVVERHNGEVVGLWAKLADAVAVVFDVSAHRPEYRRATEVVCRDGVAVLSDSYADHVAIYREGRLSPTQTPEPDERLPIGDAMPLYEELRAFVGHLQGGLPPRSSAADGLLIVERLSQLRRLAGLDADVGSGIVQ